jgi:hypothetical protein
MKVSDAAVWARWRETNMDFYGSACIRFAERWADLMEDALAWGESIAASAVRTSHEADTEAITGAQFGAACRVLYNSWAHGPELLAWAVANNR